MKMQKKKLPDTSPSSNWQESIKKQERAEKSKKYAIWGAIIAVCILAFGGLIYLTNKSTSTPSVAGRTEPNLPKVTENDIIVGNPKAKATITEYGDMQCPACAAYNPLVNEVLTTYKDQVRLVYRFFPLPQHQNAIVGAHAAYAAWKLGKFPDMKDMMFDKQKDWESLSNADAEKTFIGYAKSLGMDEAKFKALMDSKEAEDFVNNDKAEAASLGLGSTPTFFVGNQFVTPQSLEDFKKLIDAQLKSK